MIHFFRKIRQNLLARGKTGKYLKYAVGEIVLVVIGILIALQINNWNEARKAVSYEKKVVQRLITDATVDSIFYNSRLELFTDQISFYTDLYSFCARTDTLAIDTVTREGSEQGFIQAAYYSDVIHNNPDIMDYITSDSIKHTLRDYYKSYHFVSKAIEISNTNIREIGSQFDAEFGEVNGIIQHSKIIYLRDYCELENFEGSLRILINGNTNAQRQSIRLLNDIAQLKSQLSMYLKELD